MITPAPSPPSDKSSQSGVTTEEARRNDGGASARKLSLRAVCLAVVTVGLGIYLTTPVLLFDLSQRVLVLERAEIDELTRLREEFLALTDTAAQETGKEDLRKKARALIAEYRGVEAGGEPGFRLRCQEFIHAKYQEPHFLRSAFFWFAYIENVFPGNTDEYLGWLWFTVLCTNLARFVHARVSRAWSKSPLVLACFRWILFCTGAMGASMIVIALRDCGARLPFLTAASYVLAGSAYLFDQHVYRISWSTGDRMILYAALQWILLGAYGCFVVRCVKGPHLLDGGTPVSRPKRRGEDNGNVRHYVAEALKKIRAADKKEEPPKGSAPASAQEKEKP